MMADPICSIDIAMFTILAAHVGLAIGTLSRHLKRRPDLKLLVGQLLRFDTVGLYLLTERGHGLDAYSIETTASKIEDGYVLHTPREEAAKFMPASTPVFGIPKVALVMARLLVDGQNRGLRFFIVPICNEKEMYCGIRCVRLPPRSGTALVASDISDTSLPEQPLQAWWEEIWRIKLGTLAVTAPWISATKAVAYIGGRYSMHRLIGKRSHGIPILTFRTQQWPIVHTTAVAMVIANWFPVIVDHVMKITLDHRVRHALSVIAKTTICRHFQRCVGEVAERCGAQGTFEHNYLSRIENDGKGVIIAEGDVLTLCIRLFSELLLRRYTVPFPDANESLTARHAVSVFQENMMLFEKLGSNQRSESFNALLLPQSETVIEALGHALAYSAAEKAKLPQPILDVYECAVVRRDPAWYSEHEGISRLQQRIREDAAISAMLPELDCYLTELNIENYVQAPLTSDSAWKTYLATLPRFSGTTAPHMYHMPAKL